MNAAVEVERSPEAPTCWRDSVRSGWARLTWYDRLACKLMLALLLLGPVVATADLYLDLAPANQVQESWTLNPPSSHWVRSDGTPLATLTLPLLFRPGPNWAPDSKEFYWEGPSDRRTFRSVEAKDPWGQQWVLEIDRIATNPFYASQRHPEQTYRVFSSGPDGVFESGAGDDLSVTSQQPRPAWHWTQELYAPWPLLLFLWLAFRQARYPRSATWWANALRAALVAFPFTIPVGFLVLLACKRFDLHLDTPGLLVPWQVSVVGGLHVVVSLVAFGELTTRRDSA